MKKLLRTTVPLAVVLMLSGACDNATTGSDSGTAGTDAAPLDGGPPGCAPDAPIPGYFEGRMLDHGGLSRTYRIVVPTSYDRTPTPLVLNFHGFSSDAGQQEFLSIMGPKAEAEGFILAYPEGTGVAQSFNAGTTCCGDALANGVDDVGFTSAMIDDISSYLCVDADRIYATGMSNGGFMSHRLGCELADRIAAVAPVAGVLNLPTCNPSRPMPIITFNGTLDTLVLYDGNPTLGIPSVADSADSWVMRNGCDPTPTTTFMNGDSFCETWSNCDAGADVVMCTVTGGGHTWPGGSAIPMYGYTTYDLIANDAMWDFFVAHPMP